MADDQSLLPGPLLRRAGRPKTADAPPIRIEDARLASALPSGTKLLCLHEGTVHGEGTVWDTARGRLVWSDVPNRRVLGWYPDGRVEVLIEGAWFPNGNALEPGGTLVHCEHGRRCISRSDGEGGAPVPIVTRYEGKRLNSPNDVCVAADGAIWFTDPMFGILMPDQGSLAEPELRHCSVYRFDPATGILGRMADFEQPNGLAFAPDGRTLYVSDTSASLEEVPNVSLSGSAKRIEAFAVGADNALSGRRPFFEPEHGVPDGFAVDARGWVWTTAGDGVHVVAPDGTWLGCVPTPTTASNCAFGGVDGRRLFIAAEEYLLAIDLAA